MSKLVFALPISLSFIVFTVLFLSISLAGLFITKEIGINRILCEDHNSILENFITVVSVFVGIIITFIIMNSWENFDKVKSDVIRESNEVLLLSRIIRTFDSFVELKSLILEYLQHVINIEFPAFNSNKGVHEAILQGDKIIKEIQIRMLSSTSPNYDTAVDIINKIISHRHDRIYNGINGINSLVWFVVIINSLLIIFMSWFLVCNSIAHYILVGIVAVYISSVIFLSLVLSYPYRGTKGITSEPFKQALEEIMVLYG